jgi:hypothetical protein
VLTDQAWSLKVKARFWKLIEMSLERIWSVNTEWIRVTDGEVLDIEVVRM